MGLVCLVVPKFSAHPRKKIQPQFQCKPSPTNGQQLSLPPLPSPPLPGSLRFERRPRPTSGRNTTHGQAVRQRPLGCSGVPPRLGLLPLAFPSDDASHLSRFVLPNFPSMIWRPNPTTTGRRPWRLYLSILLHIRCSSSFSLQDFTPTRPLLHLQVGTPATLLAARCS